MEQYAVQTGFNVWAVVGTAVVVGVLLLAVVLSYLRRVVNPNQVHIVQSSKTTTSYGISTKNGNVYYAWPSWIPVLGVTTVVMPVSNFDLSLNGYEAYDQDKVPFKVDVTSFFMIENTNVAAQRVSSIAELNDQLMSIVQGAVRTILATYTIDDIMLKREIFGDAFTKAVTPQLEGWGVVPVKNLELMDIRDANDSHVIHNIMAKKKSHIEMESRVEVANNNQKAEEAEIAARQEVDLKAINAKQFVDLRDVEAKRVVGEKTADQERTVGLASEKSRQEVAAEQAVTAERDMAVRRVNALRQAEIERDQAAVELDQAGFRADAVVREGTAEATKRKLIFEADNALEVRLQMQKETSIGVAKALAEGGVSLVPKVFIGGNTGEGGESGSSSAIDTLVKIMAMNMATTANIPNDDDDNVTDLLAKATRSYTKK